MLTSHHLCSHHVVVGLAGTLHSHGTLSSTLVNHGSNKLWDGSLSLFKVSPVFPVFIGYFRHIMFLCVNNYASTDCVFKWGKDVCQNLRKECFDTWTIFLNKFLAPITLLITGSSPWLWKQTFCSFRVVIARTTSWQHILCYSTGCTLWLNSLANFQDMLLQENSNKYI